MSGAVLKDLWLRFALDQLRYIGFLLSFYIFWKVFNRKQLIPRNIKSRQKGGETLILFVVQQKKQTLSYTPLPKEMQSAKCF